MKTHELADFLKKYPKVEVELEVYFDDNGPCSIVPIKGVEYKTPAQINKEAAIRIISTPLPKKALAEKI